MQKKRNIRSVNNNADIIITTLCLAGMACSLFLFNQDLNISFHETNKKPIAVIYYKYNTVQRRLLNHNMWERLQQAAPVYDGDRIRTANGSEAYTLFNDGNRIDLHENTLIQVFKNKKTNKVEFLEGAISVTSAPKTSGFTVDSGNKAINFSGSTTATFRVTDGTTASAAVVSGSIDITARQTEESTPFSLLNSNSDIFSKITSVQSDQSGKRPEIKIDRTEGLNPPAQAETQKVAAGSTYTFSIQQNTPVPEEKQKISVYMPASTYSITHKIGQTPYLPVFWNASEKVHLVFSRTADFSQILSIQDLPSGSGKTQIPMDFAQDEDTVYWQIRTDTAVQKSDSPSGIVFIHLPDAIKTIDITESAFGTAAGKDIAQIAEQAEEQKEMAAASLPKAAIPQPTSAESEVQQESTAAPLPEETAQHPQTVPAKSAKTETHKTKKPAVAKTAAVKKKEKPVKKAVKTKKIKPKKEEIPAIVTIEPVPVSPQNGIVLTDKDFSIDDPSIVFTWNKVKDASSYTFTIYEGNNTDKQLFTKTISGAEYTLAGDELSFLENGDFSWTVTAAEKKNGKLYTSKTGTASFSIKIGAVGDVEIDKSSLLLTQ